MKLNIDWTWYFGNWKKQKMETNAFESCEIRDLKMKILGVNWTTPFTQKFQVVKKFKNLKWCE